MGGTRRPARFFVDGTRNILAAHSPIDPGRSRNELLPPMVSDPNSKRQRAKAGVATQAAPRLLAEATAAAQATKQEAIAKVAARGSGGSG